MAKKVYIAEAVRSEKDNDKAGWNGTAKPGDQLQTVKEQADDFTGECRMSEFKPFATVVFRYKDREKAKKHAEAAKFFVNSLYVGYNQSTRLTLKNYIKSLGYANYKKITKKKETDCSALQCLCSNIAGVSAVKDWNSNGMIENYKKLTDDFETLTDSKYLTSSDYLMEGDILVKPGHAACVLNDGNKVNTKPEEPKPVINEDKDGNGLIDVLQEPKSKNDSLAGKYVATQDVNMRYGPNSSIYDVIRVIKKGEQVNNYSYYTQSFLYVKDTRGNKGFVSKKYLKKK